MRSFLILILLACAAPLAAKDSLGVFAEWAAFQDTAMPRCYAIAAAEPSRLDRENEPYVTIGTWPRRQLRGQLHFRLSRALAGRPNITLRIGRRSFRLTGGGSDAWAQDRSMDAAIVAAMRSANTMTVRATDSRGRRFSDSYSLSGAASAMDAATLACARR